MIASWVGFYKQAARVTHKQKKNIYPISEKPTVDHFHEKIIPQT